MAKFSFIKVTFLYVIVAYLLLFNVSAQSAGDSERLFPVKVNGRYGYVDTKGKMVIKPQFDDADKFHEGLAGVNMGGQKRSGSNGYVYYAGGKFGYIDKTGKFVIPLGKYEFGRGFSEGLAEVRANRCFENHCIGFIDRSGKLVINTQFSSVGTFHEGLAIVELPNGKKGMIDKTGKLVIPAIYDGMNDISDGIIVANTLNGPPPKSILDDKLPRYGTVFLDKNGNIIAHSEATVFGSFSEGLCLGLLVVNFGTRDVELEGVVDKTGKWVIEPRFRRVGSFVGGLAPAQVAAVGYKWGFIDRNGKFAIEPVFDHAEQFVDGLAEVKINGQTGFIDTTGKMVIEPRSWEVEKFVDGHAFVTEGGFTGYIDNKGKFLWKIKFDQ
jgi:hypothetical protein